MANNKSLAESFSLSSSSSSLSSSSSSSITTTPPPSVVEVGEEGEDITTTMKNSDTSMCSSTLKRKRNKPLIEKRRRARINDCLQQLQSIVMEDKTNMRFRSNRLEKADILELTVEYLKTILGKNHTQQQQQQQQKHRDDEEEANNRKKGQQQPHRESFTPSGERHDEDYKRGFLSCINEIGTFLQIQDHNFDSSTTNKLLCHCQSLLTLEPNPTTALNIADPEPQEHQRGGVKAYSSPSTRQPDSTNVTNSDISGTTENVHSFHSVDSQCNEMETSIKSVISSTTMRQDLQGIPNQGSIQNATIVPTTSQVFPSLQYQSSSIYLHNDPPEKKQQNYHFVSDISLNAVTRNEWSSTLAQVGNNDADCISQKPYGAKSIHNCTSVPTFDTETAAHNLHLGNHGDHHLVLSQPLQPVTSPSSAVSATFVQSDVSSSSNRDGFDANRSVKLKGQVWIVLDNPNLQQRVLNTVQSANVLTVNAKKVPMSARYRQSNKLNGEMADEMEDECAKNTYYKYEEPDSYVKRCSLEENRTHFNNTFSQNLMSEPVVYGVVKPQNMNAFGSKSEISKKEIDERHKDETNGSSSKSIKTSSPNPAVGPPCLQTIQKNGNTRHHCNFLTQHLKTVEASSPYSVTSNSAPLDLSNRDAFITKRNSYDNSVDRINASTNYISGLNHGDESNWSNKSTEITCSSETNESSTVTVSNSQPQSCLQINSGESEHLGNNTFNYLKFQSDQNYNLQTAGIPVLFLSPWVKGSFITKDNLNETVSASPVGFDTLGYKDDVMACLTTDGGLNTPTSETSSAMHAQSTMNSPYTSTWRPW